VIISKGAPEHFEALCLFINYIDPFELCVEHWQLVVQEMRRPFLGGETPLWTDPRWLEESSSGGEPRWFAKLVLVGGSLCGNLNIVTTQKLGDQRCTSVEFQHGSRVTIWQTTPWDTSPRLWSLHVLTCWALYRLHFSHVLCLCGITFPSVVFPRLYDWVYIVKLSGGLYR
jgi:hypothetical protein